MPFDPGLLTGSVAALVLSIWIIKQLWDAHKAADADVRAQRDAALVDLRAQIQAADRGAESQLALARQVGELTAQVARRRQ